MPAGFQFVGTATPTAFNYAEDPSDVAGYMELSVGGPPGAGVWKISTNGHMDLYGQTPAAAAGANAGGSPPAPVVATGCNDGAGTITFGTGSAPAAGVMVTVTFGHTWSVTGGGAPHIVVTPNNAVTQALGLYAVRSGATGWNLSAANAPAAGQANTVYSFSYHVIG